MFTPMTFVNRLTVLARAVALTALLCNVSVAAQYDEVVEVIQSLEKIGFSNTEIATEIRSQFGNLDEATLQSLQDSGVNQRVVDLLASSKDTDKAPDSVIESTPVVETDTTSTTRANSDPQAFTRVDELYEVIENLTRLGFTDEEIYARIFEEQDLPDQDDIDDLEERGVSEQLIGLLRDGEEPVRGRSRPKRDKKEERDSNDDRSDSDVTDGLTIPISQLRERLADGETLEEIIISIAEDGYSVTIDNDTIQELQEDGRLLDVMVPLIDPDEDTSVSMPEDSVDDDNGGFLAGTGRRTGSALLDVDNLDGNDQTRITLLLSQAQTAFDNLRLTTPKGDSAFDYYNQVLEIEPGNADAHTGINRIVDRYIELARSAASKGQRRIAKGYLATAKRVSPAATTRVDAAQTAMLPAFDPDQLQSVSEAKRAYLQGKLTKRGYQAVVARLRAEYRKTVNDLKIQLQRGNITRIEYKQKARSAKLKLQG